MFARFSLVFAILLYLAGSLAMVLSSAITKYVGVSNILATSEIVLMKSLLSVLLLLPFNCKYVADKQIRRKMRENILLLLALGIATLVSQFAWINAIKLIPMNNAWLTVMILSPVMSALGGKIFFKEKVSNQIKLAFVVNVFAILLINKFVVNKIDWNVGYLLLLGDLFAYSIIILLTRKLRDLPSELVVFVRFLVVLPLSIIAVRHIPECTLEIVLFTGMIALFCTIGRFLQTRTYKYLEVSVVQPLRYFDVVFGIFVSFIVLGEKPTLYQILGTIIIIASGFLVASNRDVKK